MVVTAGSAVASKLGTKWNCFRCAAKFYDLHKPEPLCPKCGADQRQRPKVSATPPPAPAPRKQPRPMAPLLEDEDDGSVRYDEDIDLGVRTEIDEPEEELFPPGEFEEDDVFNAPDEE
ncbi:MAG: TIGR02300 family protein [Proteobacteria bacterium]|nr:MAG: TIGR02300 family protein [Pseudomonadota bacterium]